MPTVLLIRHAQASFGAADYDVLSPTGERQVEALAARGIRADRLVSGSLRRQRDTAIAWAGSEVTVDPRWDEYSDVDVLSHHAETSARLSHADGEAAQMDSRAFQVILDAALAAWARAGANGPSDEPYPAFLDRVTDAFQELAGSLNSGQTGVAITSGGVIAALGASLLGIPSEDFVALQRVSINTAITKVVIGRQGRTLVSFNEHSHLEADPALLTYR